MLVRHLFRVLGRFEDCHLGRDECIENCIRQTADRLARIRPCPLDSRLSQVRASQARVSAILRSECRRQPSAVSKRITGSSRMSGDALRQTCWRRLPHSPACFAKRGPTRLILQGQSCRVHVPSSAAFDQRHRRSFRTSQTACPAAPRPSASKEVGPAVRQRGRQLPQAQKDHAGSGTSRPPTTIWGFPESHDSAIHTTKKYVSVSGS